MTFTKKRYSTLYEISRFTYAEFINLIDIPDTGDVSALTYVLTNKDSIINKDAKNKKLILEFGVFTGSTIRQIARAFHEYEVYGFDSFEGLPETWRPGFERGTFSMQGNVPHIEEPNVKLVTGWFDKTLPKFVKEHWGTQVAFVHIDCDLYSSTKIVLQELNKAKMIGPGTVIVFDELVNNPAYLDHEMKALYEFLVETNFAIEFLALKGPFVRNPAHVDDPEYGKISESVACILKPRTLIAKQQNVNYFDYFF